MSTSRRLFILVAVALGLTAVNPLVAPGLAQPATDLLRLTWWTDVGFPTPFAFSTVGPGGIARLSLIYDTLLWKNENGLIPWLASSWRVTVDGKAYVFTLHPNVSWHDGSPFSARDVKFSFDYYRRHPFKWVDTAVVDSVEARDRRTVVIKLKEPYAPFLEEIASIVPIIPEHIWQFVAQPERLQELSAAVGTGPYRLVDYRPEVGQYRFIANPNYFKGKPLIGEIQYVLTPRERELLAVQNGEVDAASGTTYDVVRTFADHPYLRVLETEPLSVARVIFNMERPPTIIKAFRQAIAYALDRKRIGEIVTRGPAPVGSVGVIPPGDPWFNREVKVYPYDPDRARALLRSLGYVDRDGDGWLEAPTGERLQIELLTSPVRDAELIQSMLKEVGIEVKVRAVDPTTRATLAAEGKFQIAFTTHTGTGGDPDYLRTWFTGESANLFARGSALRQPEFLRLAKLQVRTLDPQRRLQMIYRMQDVLAEELPSLPLYYRRFFWVYDSRKFKPIATRGGLMNAIPLIENKVAFLRR